MELTACALASRYQPGHGHEGEYCKVRCPVHGGDDDNLAIGDKKSGGLYVQCWSHECDFREILKELGVESPARGSGKWEKCGINRCKSDTGSRVAVYDHEDGGKRCVHRIPCIGPACTYPKCTGKKSKHVWGPGKPDGTHLLLWGEDDPANLLVITEGEKDAAALVDHGVNEMGYTPVSWRGGAGKEKVANFERVKARTVVLWPDNDDQGLEAMAIAAQRADAAGAEKLFMVDISQLPDVSHEGAGAADVDSDTALDLIGNAPEHELPDDTAKPAPAATKQTEQFGPQADLDFTSLKALSATANAVRLLMLCPENLMVSLNEEEEATLRVCNPDTGVWRRSEVHVGAVIEQSLERWERYLISPDRERELSQGNQTRLRTWIGRSRSPLGHKAIRNAVSAAVGILQEDPTWKKLVDRGLILCMESDVDAQMGYIGAPNGVVDLNSGKLMPPAEGRTKLVSLSTGTDYVFGAHQMGGEATEAVELLLDHLDMAERQWIEGYLGYAMRGSPDGWAWLVGPSGSGKTTLLEATQSALGEYAFTIPRKMLSERVQSDHSEGVHLFTSGARLAIASDILSDVDMESSLIKGLATGDIGNERRAWGLIEGTGKQVSASMILGFNEGSLPKIPFTDDGFMRRLRLLRYAPIPETVKKPKSYRDAFKTSKAHREAILAWLVDCARTHTELPADTPGGREMLADVQRGIVGARLFDWLTSRVEHTNVQSDRIATSELWHEATKESPGDSSEYAFGLTRNKFSRSVRQVFSIPPAKTARIGGVRQEAWFGLKWKEPERHETQGELT